MKNDTGKEREEHVENWKAGGLSKSAYAKSVGIHPATFYTWTREESPRKTVFVQIRKERVPENPQALIIEKGSLVVRVPLPSGLQALQTVFAALGTVQ